MGAHYVVPIQDMEKYVASFIPFLFRSRRGGALIIIHGRSRMTIDPRTPTMPGVGGLTRHVNGLT